MRTVSSARLALFLGLFVSSLALGACSDSKSSKKSDAGEDSGAGKDSGLKWMPDSGGLGTGDSGVVRDCAKPKQDLSPKLLPRCSNDTLKCIEGCENKGTDRDACQSACLKADTTPPIPGTGLGCQACIYLQLLTCADQNGCHDSVSDFFCCVSDKCPSGSASDCTDKMCSTPVDDALTCVASAHPTCLDFTMENVGKCFGDTGSGNDAGAGDAGH
ncbi:MAG TPA: hypothetical protein VHM19_13740 [Polyangiales bacterium]|jgi:hypothetical protein|nr:hypothetical protein [Polyangiales bacterium]